MEDEDNLDEAYDDGYEGGLSVADAESMLGQTEDYGEPAAPGAGLSYLGLPGYDVAMEKLIESNDQARAALRQARERLAARKYNSAIGLLAVSGALLSPTRTGGFGESVGNAANAMIGPLQAKDAFEQNRDKELLGIDTSLAGLDQSTAKAHLDLAKLRAELAAKEAALPNDRVVLPNGDVVWRARPDARRPGYEAWTPPANKLTIDQRGETEQSKTINKFYGDDFADMQRAGRAAGRRKAEYLRMQDHLQGIKTGKLTPLVSELQALGEFFGIKVNKNLGPMQAAEAISHGLALQFRNPAEGAGMPGALSNADRIYLKQMVPGLAKTPEGNRLIIETAAKLADREMEVAQRARDYLTKHGKMDEGFYNELDKWSRENHLFGESSPEKDIAAAAAARDEVGMDEESPPLPRSGIPPLLRRPDAPVNAVPVPAIPSADDAAATQPGTISFYDLPRRK